MRNAQFLLVPLLFGLALAGCSVPEHPLAPGEVHDPYEGLNRPVHSFNRGVDRALIGPVSRAYVAVTADQVQQGVDNFSNNLGNPSNAVNSLLQGRPDRAMVALGRFVVNSTIGVLGLMDPASHIGLEPARTDFGETLAVWGVQEGAYQELPLLGPSTERATAGLVMDVFMDPLSFRYTGRKLRRTRTIATSFQRVGDRGRNAETVEGILYRSEDSYAQLRSAYIQNRRFKVAGGTGQSNNTDEMDPYEDPYDDPYFEADAN